MGDKMRDKTDPPKNSKDKSKDKNEVKTAKDETKVKPKECPICLEPITNKCRTDPCAHEFCFHCLSQWTREHNYCPVCRQVFDRILHDIRGDDQYRELEVDNRESRVRRQLFAQRDSMHQNLLRLRTRVDQQIEDLRRRLEAREAVRNRINENMSRIESFDRQNNNEIDSTLNDIRHSINEINFQDYSDNTFASALNPMVTGLGSQDFPNDFLQHMIRHIIEPERRVSQMVRLDSSGQNPVQGNNVLEHNSRDSLDTNLSTDTNDSNNRRTIVRIFVSNDNPNEGNDTNSPIVAPVFGEITREDQHSDGTPFESMIDQVFEHRFGEEFQNPFNEMENRMNSFFDQITDRMDRSPDFNEGSDQLIPEDTQGFSRLFQSIDDPLPPNESVGPSMRSPQRTPHFHGFLRPSDHRALYRTVPSSWPHSETANSLRNTGNQSNGQTLNSNPRNRSIRFDRYTDQQNQRQSEPQNGRGGQRFGYRRP